MDNTPLALLCTRAGICATKFWMSTWFEGCSLTKNQLLCPDMATAKSVERLFLPQLRAVLSDVEIRVAGTGEKPQNSWQPARKKVWNAKAEPTDQDML